MVNLGGFNANDVEPSTGFTVVPAAQYVAMIKASEMKDTKAKTGKYLELTFEIIEGEQKGNTVFARLNLTNPSKIAVDIAKSDLSAICRAVGVMTPHDSVDLHNLPLVIDVTCEDRKDKPGTMSNNIKSYKSKGEAAPAAATPAVAPIPGAPAEKAPWDK